MPTNLLDTNQLHEEYARLSSFELCFHSQELVQDLISKTSEFVLQLRPLSYSLLTSDHQTYLFRKGKVEDLLKTVEVIFQRLRTLGSLVHQRQLALDQEQKQEEEDITTNIGETRESLDQLKREKEELIEQLREKNRYVKLAIDKVSDILWQINSIQTLKQ